LIDGDGGCLSGAVQFDKHDVIGLMVSWVDYHRGDPKHFALLGAVFSGVDFDLMEVAEITVRRRDNPLGSD
jgi:hypothetical protein